MIPVSESSRHVRLVSLRSISEASRSCPVSSRRQLWPGWLLDLIDALVKLPQFEFITTVIIYVIVLFFFVVKIVRLSCCIRTSICTSGSIVVLHCFEIIFLLSVKLMSTLGRIIFI